MATAIASGLGKADEAIQSASSKDKKLVDISRQTVNVHLRDKSKGNFLDLLHTGPFYIHRVRFVKVDTL